MRTQGAVVGVGLGGGSRRRSNEWSVERERGEVGKTWTHRMLPNSATVTV